MAGAQSVWAQYTIQTARRDAVAASCKKAGVPTAIYYPLPLSRQTGYRDYPSAPGGTPVSERLAQEVLSLPMHPYLDEATQDRIVEAVRAGRSADHGHSRQTPRRHRRRGLDRIAHGRSADAPGRARDRGLRQLRARPARESRRRVEGPARQDLRGGRRHLPERHPRRGARRRRRRLPFRGAVAPAMSRISARRFRREHPRHVQRARSLRQGGRAAPRLFLVGLGLWRRGRRADDRGPSLQQQEFLRRDQDRRRGDGARVPSSLRAQPRRACAT